MASANQRKATFISHKLKFLKDQGDHLISAVGDYVNRIIAARDLWTQGGDNNIDYQELCHMIDTAVELLCEKCEELSGVSVGDMASQSTAPSSSTRAISYSQPAAPLASTVTISYRQPAAPLASTSTISYRQSTESVQPADGDHMKPILERIAVIEEAMRSFKSRTEKVAEQQSDIDQQLKEVLTKLSESDKIHSSRLKQLKQHTRDISDAQDAIEEQKTRLDSLEKQLQKISTTQKRQKAEMESQSELVDKLVHVLNLLKSVKVNVDALGNRIDGIIRDCRNNHEDIETVTRDLSDRIIANTHSVQLKSEGQAQNTTLLRELETRLQTLEADGGRNVKDVQKQAEKGEANFRILCQMFNDRLRPLEQLRTCFNERARLRDDNVRKLSQLIQEVAVMSPRLQQLEVKSSGTRCGFTASASFTGKVASSTIIRHYTLMKCNVGENFNAHNGIFTAPVDGLYVAAISLWLSGNEILRVSVKKRSLDPGPDTYVCRSSAATKDTSACNVGVVDMKAGDVLFSFADDIEKNNCNKWVTFSSFLLG